MYDICLYVHSCMCVKCIIYACIIKSTYDSKVPTTNPNSQVEIKRLHF